MKTWKWIFCKRLNNYAMLFIKLSWGKKYYSFDGDDGPWYKTRSAAYQNAAQYTIRGLQPQEITQ